MTISLEALQLHSKKIPFHSSDINTTFYEFQNNAKIQFHLKTLQLEEFSGSSTSNITTLKKILIHILWCYFIEIYIFRVEMSISISINQK
jgi:hypothetical protein